MNGKMIFKFAAVAAVVCVASAARVYALAGISLGADDSVYFGTAVGTNATPVGDAVYMGQFTISDAAVAALESGGSVSAANYATLLADFVPLNGVSLQLIGAGTGFAGTMSPGAYSGSNAGFAGGGIYVLAVNAPTSATATQVGVYKGDASWVYPANMNTGAATINLDNVVTPLIGSELTGLADSTVPYNTSANGNDESPISLLKMAPIVIVPEPSSILLVATGLIGLLGLRRRS